MGGLIEAKALPGSDGYAEGANALYVAGLPDDTTDVDLYHIFSGFGAIPPRGIRTMMNEYGTCKGIAFVNYVHPESLQSAAMTLNGATMPNGNTLTVKPKDPKADAGAGGVQQQQNMMNGGGAMPQLYGQQDMMNGGGAMPPLYGQQDM